MTSSFSLNARKKLYRLAFGLIISLLAMAFGHHSLALPDDRDQPIKIDADRAIRNDKAGITEFIGNATLIQGSMVIKAHNITISQSNKGISDITALGSPATFEQRPQLDQTLVTAKAKRIEYNIGSEIVKLLEDASIDQDGSTITSDNIHYDIGKSLAEASGEKRVNIVIQPNNQ